MRYIFLHGLGQTPESWSSTIRHMERVSDITCPDLSVLTGEKELTYRNLYEAFCESCEGFSDPFQLCGLSLGGILALHYAIEHPKRVGAMALIGVQYVMPKTLLKLQNAAFVVMPERMFRQMGFEKKDVIRLSRSMEDLDFSADLHKITCPSLLICGEKDKANKKAAMEMKERLQLAELKFIENAGHEVNKDAPEALGGLLDDFFCNAEK